MKILLNMLYLSFIMGLVLVACNTSIEEPLPITEKEMQIVIEDEPIEEKNTEVITVEIEAPEKEEEMAVPQMEDRGIIEEENLDTSPKVKALVEDEEIPNENESTVASEDFSLDELTNSSEMIFIPSGEFVMGCSTNDPMKECFRQERLLHTVFLDAYYIDKYEVTNDQYLEFLNNRGDNDCSGFHCIDPDDGHIKYQSGQFVMENGYSDHPVNMVTWYGADAYCNANGRRLPTEAEWEKAARGINDTRGYPWGDVPPDCTLGNVLDCNNDTMPIGSYPTGASPFGVHDMAGNVGEWVNDWFDKFYYFKPDSPSKNPQGSDTGTFKIARGGSWSNAEQLIRLDHRRDTRPEIGGNGVRCASSTEK